MSRSAPVGPAASASDDIPATPRAAASASASAGARIDRLPRTGLALGGYLALGICYFFAFYDINVVGTVLPTVIDRLRLSESQISLPITANLIAYMVGAFALGTTADRIGRRRALAICVSLLAVASLATGLSWDLASLTVFRTLTGLAMGAQIALLGTFITELAPAARRGKLLAVSIIWAAAGQAASPILGTWLLPATGQGWRILFALAAASALALPLLNDRRLPESPRWLELRGQRERADAIVSAMEQRLTDRHVDLPAPDPDGGEQASDAPFPVVDLFRRPFRSRLLVVFGFWFCLYFSVYAFNVYEENLLAKLNVGHTSAVTLAGIASIGGIIAALVQPALIERLQRRTLIAASLALIVIGLAALAVAPDETFVVVGAFLVSAGIFATIIPAYSYTAEVFPTRARGSAMGIGDGIGHLGGALQPYLVVPLLAADGPRSVFWALAGVLLIGAVFIAFGVRSTGKTLAELGAES